MSLSAKSSLQSIRRKFFMNSTYIMSRKVGIKRFLGSGGQNESKCQKLGPIREKKNFS